jgi:hypothetical protein
LSLYIINTNIYNREKRDYYIRLPTLPRAESLDIYSNNDDSDNDIYINASEDEELNELQAYLSEKRQSKQVSNLFNIYKHLLIL